MRLPERIKWSHVRRLYEALEPHLKASPVKLERPDKGRVLVLAPHIDDDIIGCGGTLRKHVLSGSDVMTVYFADCTQERIKEAREAAAVVGISDLNFFEYESKTLYKQSQISERLAEIIEDYKPDIVYMPSLFERHNDHLAINHHLSASIKKCRWDFTVCAYEVWTTFVPNLIVDISDVIDKKKEAISKYKSQLASNDWLDAAVSLNRYRGVTSGAGAYVEGFMRYSVKEYFSLWRRVYAE